MKQSASPHPALPPLLDIRDLSVRFGPIVANRDVTLHVTAGETLGIVGESGSGKSVLCRAILRLLPPKLARVEATELRFGVHDLLRCGEAEMRTLRSRGIGMIFQNPMTSLNPVRPIGGQIVETLRLDHGYNRDRARAAGIALLEKVGIASPQRRFDEYPFQWSGGMLQRAVIAMALVGNPQLMLADEPTTALDATIQDQILALLMELQDDTGMALVLVSHDMGVVAETCDRIAVMYAGSIVETGPVERIFDAPAHPYTRGLLQSIPRGEAPVHRLATIPGQPPSLDGAMAGCAFRNRCPLAGPDCATAAMPLRPVGDDHFSACIRTDAAGEPQGTK
jgi:peptide/nickel transport system ATP-binding protein